MFSIDTVIINITAQYSSARCFPNIFNLRLFEFADTKVTDIETQLYLSLNSMFLYSLKFTTFIFTTFQKFLTQLKKNIIMDYKFMWIIRIVLVNMDKYRVEGNSSCS